VHPPVTPIITQTPILFHYPSEVLIAHNTDIVVLLPFLKLFFVLLVLSHQLFDNALQLKLAGAKVVQIRQSESPPMQGELLRQSVQQALRQSYENTFDLEALVSGYTLDRVALMLPLDNDRVFVGLGF